MSSSPSVSAALIPSITINGVTVSFLNEPVGNLGVVFNPNMNISAHLKLKSQLINTLETNN